MPVSAYVQSAGFFVLAAVALFASAGTFAIPSFLDLSGDFCRRIRWRPSSGSIPVCCASACVRAAKGRRWRCGSSRWCPVPALDRRRARPRPFALERQRAAVAPGCGPLRVRAPAYALCFWAMAVNRFFSSVVRIQADRGQYVVTTGPYAVIRHPGYTAGILIILASGVALGSWLAAARAGDRKPAVSAVPRHHRRPVSSSRTSGLPRTMPNASAGACCREFGEAEEGIAASRQIRL